MEGWQDADLTEQGRPAPSSRRIHAQSQVNLMARVRGQVWLGLINQKPPFQYPFLRQWQGERVHPGSVHFLLGCYDAELEAMLAERYRLYPYSREADEKALRAILNRIGRLGGEFVC